MPITGLYVGACRDLPWFVPGVPTTDALVKAWLTIKVNATDPDPGVVQKIITTLNQAGVGQIVQDGSVPNGNGIGLLVFNLTITDTTTLGVATPYVYDVQVELSSGKIFTIEEGPVLGAQRRVTVAQS